MLDHSKRLLPCVVTLSLLLAPLAHTRETPDDAAMRTLADAYNRTALDLYPLLTEDGEDFVFSPYSIGTAMAMTYAGAKGETAGEMSAALHLPTPISEVTGGNRALSNRMDTLNEKEGIVLNVANALALAAHGGLIHQDYRELLKTQFGAELFGAKGVDPINRWVAENTNNMIKKLLDKLPPNPVCVILNAVYFNGTWLHTFNEDSTRPRPFHLTTDKTVDVPMMEQVQTFQFAELDDIYVISLPYKAHDLRMLMVVPKRVDGLHEVEKELVDYKGYTQLVREIGKAPAQRVHLRMPRFKIESRAALVQPFQELGMKKAFSAGQANFAGMLGKDTAKGDIWIADIVHKAVIDVTEEGTEAAAATAVAMATRAMRPQQPVKLTVDRPFLYMLTDRKTDAILFMGRVTDPR